MPIKLFFIQSHSNFKKRKSEKEENIIKINGRGKCCFAQIGRRALSSKQFPSIKYQLIFFFFCLFHRSLCCFYLCSSEIKRHAINNNKRASRAVYYIVHYLHLISLLTLSLSLFLLSFYVFFFIFIFFIPRLLIPSDRIIIKNVVKLYYAMDVFILR